MATNVIFKNINGLQPWRDRYVRSRGVFSIWDANLHHGDIRPFACPEKICSGVGAYKTLYPLPECKCLGFTNQTDVVKGFCDNSYYYLDGGRLKHAVTSELCVKDSTCYAGVPVNPTAPVAVSSCSGCDGLSVSYVITYLVQQGGTIVEGSPSPASIPVASKGSIPGVSVSWGAAPSGYCITKTRLYRTETEFGDKNPSADGAEFVLVAEFAGSGARTYVDNVPSYATGMPLVTYNPMSFPAPHNLTALTRIENALVVASGSKVYISNPGEPQFTWDRVVQVQDKVLGLAGSGDMIYVFTNKRPAAIYVAFTSGITNLTLTTFDRNLPLASKESIAVYNSDLIFSSKYGLYSISASRNREGAVVLKTQALLTPEQWKNLDPYSVTGTAYEFGYIFSTAKLNYSLMLELGNDGTDTVNITSLMPISYINGDAFALTNDGDIVYRQGSDIYSWDWRRGTCKPFDPWDNVIPTVCERCECCPWSVKFFCDNGAKNHFSHMRVEWDERSAESLQISFHIHEFGREIDHSDTMDITSSRGFGIPFNNVSYQSCYAHLRGCGIVTEVKLATSAAELVYENNQNIQAESE